MSGFPRTKSRSVGGWSEFLGCIGRDLGPQILPLLGGAEGCGFLQSQLCSGGGGAFSVGVEGGQRALDFLRAEAQFVGWLRISGRDCNLPPTLERGLGGPSFSSCMGWGAVLSS